MPLALTVVVALVLILLSLVGYWRDARRGVLALAGTLFGAVLVDFWGARTSVALAKQFGGDAGALEFPINCMLLLIGAVLLGYGGGMLLNRMDRASFSRRLLSMLLGLLNGVLIIGYVLRYATVNNAGFTATVRSTPLVAAIFDGLPYLLLGTAALFSAVVLIRAMTRMARSAPAAQAPAPKPATKPVEKVAEKPAAAPNPNPAPQQRGETDARVANKIEEALRRTQK